MENEARRPRLADRGAIHVGDFEHILKQASLVREAAADNDRTEHGGDACNKGCIIGNI